MATREVAPSDDDALARYGALRDEHLARIVRELQQDERVAAAWLAGSFGRGEADEWSDLDLHVAVADADYAAFLNERADLYRRVGDPLLVQAEMASNSVNGGRFQLVLYAGCINVDWNIGPLSLATRPAAARVLFEHRIVPLATPAPITALERGEKAAHWLVFFWAMAPIAIKYVGRTETRPAAGQIGLCTTALIALTRLVRDASGPDPWQPTTNRLLEPEIDALLPRLGPRIDPLSCLEVIHQLCDAVEQLHPGLATLGATVDVRVPAEVRELARLADGVIHLGDQPARKHR